MNKLNEKKRKEADEENPPVSGLDMINDPNRPRTEEEEVPVFDIPIFTEDFLVHNKSKNLF